MIQLAQQFRLLSSFFGLSPSNKLDIHKSLFNFVYAAPGFTFDNIYNMPVHLRNFYFRQFTEMRKQEQDQIDKANQKQPTIPRMFNPPK